MTKFVYSFLEGNQNMKDLLGGKGANLAEMTKIGLPVPQGFIVTTEACLNYYEADKQIKQEIVAELFKALTALEETTNKKMGDVNNPLLVSVRSGAKVSMPGMMDTVLNLGINDEVVVGLAKLTNDTRFAYDTYRRFIQMFADVVMGLPKASFDRLFDHIKETKKVTADTDLTGEDMIEVVTKFKATYKRLAGSDFPIDPKVQLLEAVKAVFTSWNNERAIMYRRLNDIPHNWGTAVTIQEMVYGNRGDDCGTGVVFTRNPATGEKKLYGEYLINAQGEDIVAGIRTPKQIATLKEVMPIVYEELITITNLLEHHYLDMQDLEFTIEQGKLYILQTRNGKRTATAAIQIAVALVEEGLITKEEALLKVDPKSLDQLLHPLFDPDELKKATPIATGLAASPGAATGKLYFTAADLLAAKNKGEKNLILVRLETSPEDIEGMTEASGILTIRGGMTSHAAVVARGMGRCCISGCGSLQIDEQLKTITTKDNKVYKEKDYLSLDGSTGHVYGTLLKTVAPTISGAFETFMSWADNIRTLKVRTNADTVKDVSQALAFGAEGIGLCRTEHMFFEEDRIFTMRQMITAETTTQKEQALAKLLPMQRSDFIAIFKIMNGLPVTIRYLDPPLHEFLPHQDNEIESLATSLGMTKEALKTRINSLYEFNPMMGHRGCRLAITYPEIIKMQTQAIIEAAIEVTKEGIKVTPEIMIPLVSDVNELIYLKKIIQEVSDPLLKEANLKLDYTIGTMIELPRAALTAATIAQEAAFFSFGTNDLTQMTYGFSRDDVNSFLNDYYTKNIFASDPFAKLDQIGVGALMKIATKDGKLANPNLKLGICGEHGGDPSSILFCHELGLHYVSCSPYRIPIARLALAQAQLRNPR